MKEFLCCIRPTSPFGTPLKGDTLFGQLCWELAMHPEWVAEGLESWIPAYKTSPFLVVSSAFWMAPDQDWILPVPAVFWYSRAGSRKERMTEEKENRKKRWIKVRPADGIRLVSGSRLTEEEAAAVLGVASPLLSIEQRAHNTVNRRTGTTGTGMFAPYETDYHQYPEGTLLGIRVSVDPAAITPENLRKAFSAVGCFGFGKDAGIGMGQFLVEDWQAVTEEKPTKGDGVYALSPVVPEAGVWETVGAAPFIRYGKHGNWLAGTGHVFKSPVLMAAEGSVFKPHNGKLPESFWFGSGVTEVSSAMPSTVVQGYAHWLPVHREAI